MSFSKNLEYLRKSKEMSQEDLAFKLGVSRQEVLKWESGAAYPETEKITAICKLFDCSLDELMKDDIEGKKEKKEGEHKEEKTVRHDFDIFSFLRYVFVLILKLFLAFLSLFILFCMLAVVAGLVVVITWMFDGVFIFSLILFALSFILLSTTIIYVIYNFIVNKKSKWKKVFTFLLISFVGLCVSMGVGAIEMKEFTFTSSPRQDIVPDTKSETFEMTDSLIIDSAGYKIVYVENKNMQDTVRVEVVYYDSFSGVDILQNENKIFINSWEEKDSFSKVYEMLIKDLKKKEIHVDYSYLSDLSVIVYTSKENIEKIQDNMIEQRRGIPLL